MSFIPSENTKKEIDSFFIVLAIIAFLFIGLIVEEAIYSHSRPEHLIRVEYTVYSNPVRHESGVYRIKGEDFKVSQYVKYSKYAFGGNTVSIQDGHPHLTFIGRQSVCIYIGMHDVKVNKITVIK